MMWIVRLALRRPYTFAVFAFLIVILGGYSIASMPTDIFPDIDIPVVTVVWNYTGLSAQEMSTRIVFNSERGMTTTVSDIEHIESQSLNGVGIIKIFFQPHVDIGSAVAQVTAISQVQLRQLPPGTNPPFIIQYNASSVPVLMLGLSGNGLNEQRLFDLGTNTIRTQLATIEGAQTPFPYGGKQRQIQVDIDIASLQAKGLSPADVVNAISAQNLIVPSGTMKIDRYEYAIETNSAPSVVEQLNNLPITVYQWRSHLCARCCSRQRRQSSADQYCACRRSARRDDEHHEDGFGLYSQDHSRCAREDRQHQGATSAGAQNQSALRSVDLCSRCHQRRGPRGDGRRVPHRGHDPDLSGQLAFALSSLRFRSRCRSCVLSRCWLCCTRPSTS